ncbi:hypothetical protein ACJX0J_016829 [Zea mays]
MKKCINVNAQQEMTTIFLREAEKSLCGQAIIAQIITNGAHDHLGHLAAKLLALLFENIGLNFGALSILFYLQILENGVNTIFFSEELSIFIFFVTHGLNSTNKRIQKYEVSFHIFLTKKEG